MRYLCLIYDDEKMGPTMPKADADAMMGDYFAFTEGIKQSGSLDGQGRARISGIDPGMCQISFPEIDGREWK